MIPYHPRKHHFYLSTMKKLILFGTAALIAFVALSRWSQVAQARTIIAPTPTPAPVISAR